jgi:hypothetical protein
MDLKVKLDNVDKMGYDPVLLELLAIIQLIHKLEEDIMEELEENDVKTLAFENIIGNYRRALHKRIMSKMEINKFYDNIDGYWLSFIEFEEGSVGVNELIDNIKTLLRHEYVSPIEVAKG